MKRDSFSSRMGVLAAAAGSAIGLGNIWRFTYLMGDNGGAAFFIIYLASVILIGLPIMIAEFTIGRNTQKNPIGAFRSLVPKSAWPLTGWLGIIAAFSVLSFYGVVGGWTLYYLVRSISQSFLQFSPDQYATIFTNYIENPLIPILTQLIFMGLTFAIVVRGIQSGIEKYSKLLMPLLFLIVILIDIVALTMPGASEGLAFIFKPDWSKVDMNVIVMAVGQAFFSLSLGMGTMLTYASYIGKQQDLKKTALQVTVADTLVAVLAGVAIFPAVFSFNIDPTSGPGLVFITLPAVFGKMPFGQIVGPAFFLLLAIAALTSAISILEVLVAYFGEELKWGRKKATIISTVLLTLIGMIASLSNGIWNNDAFFGMNFMDFLGAFSSNYCLPIGGFFIAVFVGWRMKPEWSNQELLIGAKSARGNKLILWLLRTLVPAAIIVVFLSGIGVIG